MKENSQKKPMIILDANAFISSAHLLNLGTSNKLVTTEEVIDELKDKKTRQMIQSFPFTISKLHFEPKSLAFVKEFARKTGDLPSLSEVDLELLALAHTLYEREGQAEKLRKNPLPIREHQENEDIQQTQELQESQEEDYDDQSDNDEGEWITVPKAKKVVEKQSDDEMGEDQGWVTPQNYEKKIAEGITVFDKNNKVEEIEKEEDFYISLMTADYAMQNVATQMGMKLLSLDGRKINEIRRFVWQCYTCWKQYKDIPNNKVLLCKECGYNSLSKIAYSMDAKGNMILHRKKGWKPNNKILEWKQKKYEEQERNKKHQRSRRRKQPSIFETA